MGAGGGCFGTGWLADYGARLPAQLSGGQAGRAALARTLLRRKPVLCLDEPFAALGPALRYEMLDLVAEIVAETGATLLLVTHLPEDAAYIAEQTIVVAEGVAYPPVATSECFEKSTACFEKISWLVVVSY